MTTIENNRLECRIALISTHIVDNLLYETLNAIYCKIFTTCKFQARIRGHQARKRHLELVRHSKALIIQTNVRGWLARKRYQKSIRDVIMVQCQIRKFLARKRLKKLKLEAKSVEHQKKLNLGLENKIINLQQKLTHSEKLNKELKKNQTASETMAKEMEALKAANVVGKQAASKLKSLEAEVLELREQLEHEKNEKIDLVHQRKLETDSW